MNAVLRILSQHFNFANGICCTVCQFIELARLVQSNFGDVDWYAADVAPNPTGVFSESYELRRIGSTSSLIEATKGIEQFERGVFIAFNSTTLPSNVRREFATDDDVHIELGNSLLEIRAFDCSFFELVAHENFPFHEVFKDQFSNREIAVQNE